MAKDITQLPLGNVFGAAERPQDVVLKTIEAMNIIRSSIDNVPGNYFIAENDLYAVLGRITGYIDKLSSDLKQYIALPEVEGE